MLHNDTTIKRCKCKRSLVLCLPVLHEKYAQRLTREQSPVSNHTELFEMQKCQVVFRHAGDGSANLELEVS